MRVLFLSTWFPWPPDNGAKLRVFYLLRALAQAHEVTLVSFAFDTARPDALGDLSTLCADIRTVSMNPFLVNRVGALRMFLSLSPIVARPIPAMLRNVADLLHRSQYDAVITSTEVMIAYALRTGPSTVKILEEHNAMSRWARERYDRASGITQRVRCWVSWRKSRWYEGRMYPRFDLVTMVSEVDRQSTLSSVGADRVVVAVVPNGVDCDHNHPGLAERKSNMLVYNGALTYSANYDAMQWFLAAVYPQIKKRVPDVSLAITGSTKGADLAGLMLDDSVRLTGYLDDVRLPVAAATVCVVPIREGGGTRLKILEAMALGTPVVATPKGAEGLNVVNGEHCLIASSPEAFAAQTVSLLRRADLRERFAASARSLVEREFSWEQIGRQFVGLIEEAARTNCATRGSKP